jgi:hypothetical protein
MKLMNHYLRDKWIVDKAGNKLCSLQTLGNLFILEFGLQSESRFLVTLFLKGNNICPQERFKHFKFSRRTSYAQQLLERDQADAVGPFIESYWAERHCLLFIEEMSRQVFIKILESRSEVAATTLAH